MDFHDLMAYKKGFALAQEIFEISKAFPKEERYSLTDQVRRSSRSVCAQIAEGFRKRRYPKHFISKLTDADAENSETQVWLAFALACGYIDSKQHAKLIGQAREVGALVGTMIKRPGKFGANRKH